MAMEYPMFCYQCEQTAGGNVNLIIANFQDVVL